MKNANAADIRFWRDDDLPFLEARGVQDGRRVCYDKHTHATFSIGVITAGHSTYLNGSTRQAVAEGSVVLMNPEEVHACNPIEDHPWSYRMFYVDASWLGDLQHALGFSSSRDFQPFSAVVTRDPLLYRGLNHLYATLIDPDSDTLHKHSTAIEFFSMLQQRSDSASIIAWPENHKISRAAEFISEHCLRALTLEMIADASEMSSSQLIRAFKRRYGMPPHAYLINRRVQYSQARLKRGHGIAEVALDAGFADQAHFQRTFKRLVAATPRQYMAAL
ncbi:AraC family transcriptional regulator [Halomonas sp. PR-M31]|uniref:AraC family transcriptional regulator n=1 Tax=Halomonas sp. PR-M31 TaxID=1471202 RepID=UPI000651B6F4|nr:AraC family transcriptional regulator [Halomonas sp. PR-M31]